MVTVGIHELEDKFNMDMHPYWRLYAGQGRSNNSLYASNMRGGRENIVESYNYLLDQIERTDLRFFTIATVSAPESKHPNIYVIDRGDQYSANGSMRTTPPAMVGSTTPMAASYAGVGMIPIGKIDEIVDKRLADKEKQLRDEFKRERQIADLQRQINELNNQEPASIGDRLFALLDQHGETIFGNLLGGKGAASLRAGGAVNGIPEEEEDAEEVGTHPPNFSIDKMLYDLGRIQQALPDYNAQELLHRLANKAVASPDVIKNVIQYL